MQIGRWNHQSAGASGGHSKYSKNSRDGKQFPSSFGSHRNAPASRGGNRFPSRGGYGKRGRAPARRGGFGVFGETEAEISKFMNKTVVTTEEPVFVAEHTFADFDIGEHLKKNIIAKKYESPTPIQDKIIPHVLLGQDVVGLAETGTGKTAAFLIPLIDKVMKQKGERVLIMAPTRELAVQIEKELAGFARGLGFRGMVAVGGANIGPQISQLKHDPAFVIGTPGRLKDLMERKALDLSGFGTVVLDEADRMLDMG